MCRFMMLRFCTTRTVPCGQEHNHKVKHWECIICAHGCHQRHNQKRTGHAIGISFCVAEQQEIFRSTTEPSIQPAPRPARRNKSRNPKRPMPEAAKDTCQRQSDKERPSIHPRPSTPSVLPVRCACSSVRPLNHPSLRMSSVTELFHTSFAQTD